MGTHKELLGSCDVYREIAYSQLNEEELSGGTAESGSSDSTDEKKLSAYDDKTAVSAGKEVQ
jgi:hypothetical protein